MKLYYSPGACSQAAHILLHETQLPHESEAVDIRAKRTASGADYLTINPKGSVPALQIGDEVLTENGAILQYIGDKAGNETLLPGSGMERYRVIETLAYLGSDVHKSFSPLFDPSLGEEARQGWKDAVGKKFDLLERQLDGRDFLLGPSMTVADPYLFAMLGWTGKLGIELSHWPRLTAFRKRMEERPTVQTVMRAEGLAEKADAS